MASESASSSLPALVRAVLEAGRPVLFLGPDIVPSGPLLSFVGMLDPTPLLWAGDEGDGYGNTGLLYARAGSEPATTGSATTGVPSMLSSVPAEGSSVMYACSTSPSPS